LNSHPGRKKGVKSDRSYEIVHPEELASVSIALKE